MADLGSVADHLHLDVPGVGQVFLNIDDWVAERRAGLRRSPRERLFQFGALAHQPHAPPAAAGHRLDHQGAARGQGGEEPARRGQVRGTGPVQHWNAADLGQGAGAHLVAKLLERVRRWADEGKARRLDCPGEGGVLAEKAVAGVHGVSTRLLGPLDDLGDVEIGLRPAPAQGDRRIRPVDMQGGRVVFGIDRDRAQAEIGA